MSKILSPGDAEVVEEVVEEAIEEAELDGQELDEVTSQKEYPDQGVGEYIVQDPNPEEEHALEGEEHQNQDS